MSATSVLRRAANKVYQRAFPIYRPLYSTYKTYADRAEPTDRAPADWDRRRKDSAIEELRYDHRVHSSTSTRTAPVIAKGQESRSAPRFI